MALYHPHAFAAQRPAGLVRLLQRRLAGPAAAYIRWCADLRRRLAFQRVLHLDDRMLDDIGLTREEVEWANRLPLRMNASHEAHRLARLRREKELCRRTTRRRSLRGEDRQAFERASE